MIIVGLTGGIGSGKSTFAKIMESLGYPVYNSDIRAKQLMTSSMKIQSSLIDNFGHNVYDGNVLNREYLASIVFSNPEKLQLLNSIIHPVVAEDFQNWLGQQTSEIVFKEAAILFESGAYKQCDINVNIYADLDQRISRVVLRDKSSSDEVIKRINNQMSDQKRMQMADYTISNNDGDDLYDAAVNFIETIKKRPKK